MSLADFFGQSSQGLKLYTAGSQKFVVHCDGWCNMHTYTHSTNIYCKNSIFLLEIENGIQHMTGIQHVTLKSVFPYFVKQ